MLNKAKYEHITQRQNEGINSLGANLTKSVTDELRWNRCVYAGRPESRGIYFPHDLVAVFGSSFGCRDPESILQLLMKTVTSEDRSASSATLVSAAAGRRDY